MSGWTQYNHTYTWGNWGGWSAWQDAKVDAITSESAEQQRQVQTRQVTDYNNFTAWGAWSDWQDAWIGGSDLRQVETRTVDDPNSPITVTKYHYYRYADSAWNNGSWYKSNTYYNYEEIQVDSPLTSPSSTGNGKGYFYRTGTGNHTFWPCEELERQHVVGYNQKTQYRYRDRNHATKTQYQYRTRNKIHTYYFWKWTAWSAWSTTSQTASSDKEVNTRTTYRYISNNPKNIEDTTGQTRTIKGFVDTEFIGKQAILHIYSADGTTQYLGQTEIKSGAYELAFKLKDEPTAESGDYYVTLSIEGTTAAMALDPILAPVPEYTVTFKNYDGSILQTQTIKKGENVTMPESPIRMGYDFIGWDSTGTNIQKDTIITAQFEIKEFDVVFVDDIAGTRTTKTFKYGDKLVTPDVEDREEYDFVGWSAVLNGIKEVTENLVVMAQYKLKSYDVTFFDYEGNIVQSTKVYYADGVTPPILDSNEKYIFIAWNTSADLDYITSDLTISPIYEYAETVATPEISLLTGSYDNEQTVVLACETEGAHIYYTTDGSDPLEEKASVSTYSTKAKAATSQINGTLYTEPFTLDSSANLVVVAVKDGMNSSWYEDAKYAINTDATTERQHLVTVHDSLYDYNYSYLVDENALAVDENYKFEQFGYKLTGVYTDEAMTKTWNLTTRFHRSWCTSVVSNILSNYTYTGNLLLQKTYLENHITKKMKINNGELPMYHAQNCHEAIIDISVFNAVQEEKAKRAARFHPNRSTPKRYPFSGLLICDKCGKHYRRKTTAHGTVWICSTYNSKGKTACASKQIPESTLESVTADVLNNTNISREQLTDIIVCDNNKLIFHFKDSTTIERIWKDRSRAESWTDEMKETARQKYLARSEK